MNRSIIGTAQHGSNVCGKRIRWLQLKQQRQLPSSVIQQQQHQISQQATWSSQRKLQQKHQQQRIEQIPIHGRFRRPYSQFTATDLAPIHSPTRYTSRLTILTSTTTQRQFHISLSRASKDDVELPVSNDVKASTDTVVPETASSLGVEAPVDQVPVDADPASSPNVPEPPPTVVSDDANTKQEKQAEKIEPDANTTTTPKDIEPPTDTAVVDTHKTKDDTQNAKDGKHRDNKKKHEKSTTATKPPADTAEDVSTKSNTGIRTVDIKAISPKLEGGPPIVDGTRQYSTPEISKDAKFHKAGMNDPSRPEYQNPLHHNNPDFDTSFFQEDFKTEAEFNAAIVPAPPLDNPDGTPTYPKYLHDLADDMVNLTMLEMNELINRMADHYGFHEGILSPDVAGDGSSADGDDDGDDDGDGGAAKVEAEKTTFDVKLVSFDATIKIKIIKEVRVVVPGLGLKEAKELVEGAPVVLQKGVSKEVAEQSKEKLVALGAVIEIV